MVKRKLQILFFLIVVGFILYIYSPWFFFHGTYAGDFPLYYSEMLRDFSFPPIIWSSQNGIGLGGVNPSFTLYTYQSFLAAIFFNTLNIPWEIIYKLFYFGLFVLLSVISSFVFIKTTIKIPNPYPLLGVIIYTTNTYILMITSGGQAGIFLAYAIAPLVVAAFLQFSKKFDVPFTQIIQKNTSSILFCALIFAVQILFDIRIAYITFALIFLYCIFSYIFIHHFNIFTGIVGTSTSLLVTFFLHSFWVIPFYLFDLFSLPIGITSSKGFNFFSFADFSHSLSLLHPNWPENIFGKTYFLQPEFLLIPIIAYLFLVLIQRSNMRNYGSVLFFSLVGILGVFLSKGTNLPFGEINLFLFENIPGFNLFRDPTKFYLYIALAYSLLIPFSLYMLSDAKIKGRIIFNNTVVFFLLFFVLWTIVIRQAVIHIIPGTFKSGFIPQEYIQLEKFIENQPDFFRTLWIPLQSRFRIQSENHPLIEAENIFGTRNVSQIVHKLRNQNYQDKLRRLSIKYIVVPYDSTHEIFLKERKYDQRQRVFTEKQLDQVSWIKKIQSGSITLYENPDYYGRFYTNENKKVDYKKIDSTQYIVSPQTKEKTVLFSEAYHSGWVARINNKEISSIKTNDTINSFSIPQGREKIEIVFKPQEYMPFFYWFCGIIFLGILLFLIKPYLSKALKGKLHIF